MTPLPTRKPYAALPLLWVGVMLVLTLTPAQEMPRTPVWELLSFDTAAHAGVFAVLAALSWFSLRRQGRWPALARYAGAAVLLGCVLFGALIEVLQFVMKVGRHAEWSDLIGDSLGAALALLLAGGGWRWWQRSRLAAPLLVLLLLGSSLFFAPAGRAQGVDLTRARRTIATLAAPTMYGRGYVRQGEHRAAAYLRGRLRQLGLQPLAPDFTQPFMLDVNTFPGKLKLEASDKPLFLPGQPALQPGRDYIAAPNSGGTRGATFAKPLWLDSLIFSSADTASAWLRREVKFHTLLLTGKQQTRLATLPLVLQQHLDSAFARVTLVPKLTASLAATQAQQPRLEVLADHWRDGYVIHMRVDAKLQRAYPTQNLAALVRGSAQPDSFLVVSAHYDHLGMMGRKTYFPGANDNASGVALLLELAAHYARPENRPACSVVFLLFGAEEAGLLGSGYFVQHPLVPLSSIKFLVNLDLLGTGEEGATVVNGRLLPAAFQRLTALNEAHHYLPRLTARGAAANSDHYPFSQVGVPAFFLYTRGGSLAYHDINDRPAALSLAGFVGAYGLVRDFLDATGARP